MKRLIILLNFLSFALLVEAQNNTPYLTKSLTDASINQVKAETSGGSLAVVGTAADQARIEVYVTSNRGRNLSKDEIDKRLSDDYELSINTDNNQLTAIAKPRHNFRNWNNSLSISFKIYVTTNVSTKLNTSGGSIHLENLNGDQQFHTSGGSLSLQKVSGDSKGGTSGGSIHLSDSGGDIDLQTSGGSINADDCNGQLHLVTSGGSVRCNNISGNLYAHTSGGSVRMEDMACDLDASTSGGSMSVSIAALKKYVKLDNSGGNISLKIPKQSGVNLDISGDKIITSTLSNFNGSTSKHRMSGTLNGGGTNVTANCSGGNVHLSME